MFLWMPDVDFDLCFVALYAPYFSIFASFLPIVSDDGQGLPRQIKRNLH